MKLLKINQSGRSMIEMLGVLAIVGILSVGGIAGFSKAMFKHKLNKAMEQYSLIFDLIVSDADKWRRIQYDGKEFMLSELWKSMGVLPKEMMEKKNSSYLYDAFGNQMFIRKGEYIIDWDLYLNGENDSGIWGKTSGNICQMVVLNVLYLQRENIKYIYMMHGIGGQEGVSSKVYYYGDTYCDRERKKCLRDINVNDVWEMCDDCKNDKLCRIVAVFPL